MAAMIPPTSSDRPGLCSSASRSFSSSSAGSFAPAVADVMHIRTAPCCSDRRSSTCRSRRPPLAYEGVLNARRRFGVLARALVAFGLLKLARSRRLMFVGFLEGALVGDGALDVAAPRASWRARSDPRFRVAPRIVAGDRALCRPPGVLPDLGGQVLMNLDLWLLKSLWTGSGEVVGEYVASLNLARTLRVIPTVQAGVLFSSVAWAFASRDHERVARHVREASRFAIVIAAAVCVILGMNGGEVLAFLFSRAYAEGQQFLRYNWWLRPVRAARRVRECADGVRPSWHGGCGLDVARAVHVDQQLPADSTSRRHGCGHVDGHRRCHRHGGDWRPGARAFRRLRARRQWRGWPSPARSSRSPVR